MRRGAWLITAVLLALPAAALAEDDPFGPAPAVGSVRALIRQAQFGDPGADAALSRWLAANPAAPAADRADAFAQLCNHGLLRGLYRQAVEACKTASGDEAANDDQLAVTLIDTPPIRAAGQVRAPLEPNPYGSQSILIEVGGVTVPWLVDTGAEVSVVIASNAERMGVRYLDGPVAVATATDDVQGRMGVIDLMRIGSAWVENVPVLVLPDAQLAVVTGKPPIPAIIGLPVFTAFRRMAWLDGGKVLALGLAAPAVTRSPYRLYWHDRGIGVAVTTPLGSQGAHLDTGAVVTNLQPKGLALLTQAEKAAGVEVDMTISGAGGPRKLRQTVLPAITLTIGGAPTVLKQVAVDAEGDGAGRVGMDALAQYRTLALDFEFMTLGVEPR